MAAAASTIQPAAAAEVDVSGLTKANIPTPALVVDLDACEANIKKMADHCRQAKVGFRPHAKTHKCPEIAKRQIAAGASGICAATVPEAEALAAAGIQRHPAHVADRRSGKIARMVALASGGEQVMLSVGQPATGRAAGAKRPMRPRSRSTCWSISTSATGAPAACPASPRSSWPG